MIFGADAPKFVKNKGLSNEVTVLLDFVNITKFEPETEYIEHKSEIDCTKYIFKKGTHLAVELSMNLFKYSDPAAKFDEIYTYLGDSFVFHLHRDKDCFKKTDGTDAKFTLKEAKSFYLESLDTRGGKKDGLNLTFESLDPVTLLRGAQTTIQANEIIMSGDTIQ